MDTTVQYSCSICLYVHFASAILINTVSYLTYIWRNGRGNVVVIPPYFPSPYRHSDREFTGVSWWVATREQQWEYWWGRGYKMPHDSIQILLVVKPSQKDREFGNCGHNHCSKQRSIYTGCFWKFRPPVLHSFYKHCAVDENNWIQKLFILEWPIRKFILLLSPFMKSDTGCRKIRM